MIRRGKRPEGNFYVLDKAISEDGYLADKGLITLPGEDAKKTAAVATAMEAMKGDELK